MFHDNCDWEVLGTDDKGRYLLQCKRCRQDEPIPARTKEVRAHCPKLKGKPQPNNCNHRGESKRKVECDSCGGKVQIKVFVCEVHGECTLEKKIENLATCKGCPDRTVGTDDHG